MELLHKEEKVSFPLVLRTYLIVLSTVSPLGRSVHQSGDL